MIQKMRSMHERKLCAEIVVRKITVKQWVVKKLVIRYSHVLATPRKVHLFRSHHRITPAYNNLIDTFEDNIIPFANKMRLLRSQAGGLGAVGFNEQNVRNCHRCKHQTKKGQDGNLMYDNLNA